MLMNSSTEMSMTTTVAAATTTTTYMKAMTTSTTTEAFKSLHLQRLPTMHLYQCPGYFTSDVSHDSLMGLG